MLENIWSHILVAEQEQSGHPLHRQIEISGYICVRFRRLGWLGHVARMNDDRLPKQLLFGNLPQYQSKGWGQPLHLRSF